MRLINRGILIICLIIVGACIVILAERAYAQSKYIAVIHSYHETYTWVHEINKGIEDYRNGKNLFGKKPNPAFSGYQIKYFYMNSKQHQNDEKYFVATGNSIVKALNELKPALTILCDDEALKYIAPPLLHNPHHKFVFLGVNNDPRAYGVYSNMASPEYNVTGLISEHPFNYSIKLATELFPDRNEIIVFFDDSITGRGIHRNLMKHLSAMSAEVQSRIKKTVVSNNWEEWKKTILSSQGNNKLFIFGTLYSIVDNRGNNVAEDAIIDWIIAHSTVPELTVTSSSIRKGFLLTISNPGYVHGYLASDIADNILQNTPISQIPVDVPSHKAVHVNMERASQIGVHIPVEVITLSKYFEALGY